jgi:hypothetical protein
MVLPTKGVTGLGEMKPGGGEGRKNERPMVKSGGVDPSGKHTSPEMVRDLPECFDKKPNPTNMKRFPQI